MTKKKPTTAVTEADDFDLDIAADTLRGDIRDTFLGHIKALQKPWPQMSELEQSEAIERATKLAETVVRRAVHLIAAEGRKVITGTFEKATIKDGIAASVTVSKHDENRHTLLDSVGSAILIVVADDVPFQGQRGEAEAESDQHDLPLDDDGNEG